MSFVASLYPFLASFSKRCLLLSGLLVALILGGCVHYETDIQFHNFNTGELIQHIQLDPQIYQLDRAAVEQWLASIEQRTQAIGGHIEQPSPQEMTAIVPFQTADDLMAKFEQFFGASPTPSSQILPHLRINHSNFLVATRYQLQYELDLSTLNLNLTQGLAAHPPQLQLSLQAPHHYWNWPLPLGQSTDAQATFWLMNPLGIGGVMIICLVAAAYWLRDRMTAIRP